MFIFHFVCVTVVFAQGPESTEQRFLSGLRERRLFELAEGYVRRELAEAYDSRRRRTELTIELSRTLLESALYAKLPRRDELFAAAGRALDEAKFAGADDVWRVPVEVQRGLIELIHGELLREEAQSLAAPDAGLEAARARLRSAVAQLRKALDAADVQLRAADRVGVGPTTKPDEPTPEEWRAFKRNVDYQLARAYRNQGETYPLLSPDRTAALDQAIQALQQVARTDAADAVAWQARLDEVVCRRLLTDLEGAERVLVQIDEQSPPPEVAERARAERIRVRLDAALLDEAKKFIRDEDVDPASRTSPEVRLAVLEWLRDSAVSAAEAGRVDDAAQWQQRAAALGAIIAERHSPAWAQRAANLLAGLAATAPTSDAANLIRAAETFYQQGNVARALEIYDDACAKALAAGDAQGAFLAGFTAAAVERTRGNHAAAAERLLKLVAQLPHHPRAGEAHLAAIYETAEQLRAAPADARSLLVTYAARLEAHVVQFPADATTQQAYYLMGLLKRQQGDLNGAAAALAKAIPGGLSDPTSTTARGAAWALARIWLETTDNRFVAAEDLLTRLRETTTDEAERAAADAWLLVCDVGQTRYDAAAQRAAQLTSITPADEAAIVPRLDLLAAAQPDGKRRIVAAVMLRLLDLRRRANGATPAAPTLAEARALTLAGRTDEARAAWDAVARAAPRDGDVQEAYAEFLLTQTGGAVAAAVAKWREVERAAAANSPRWYRARIGLARAYIRHGDKQRALEVINITKALHPDLGGEATRAEFEQLLQAIGAMQGR